ncbi:MAG TPA: hypothetical protein VEA99_11590 [Gemmatimonadaceae bacterium]|nr:hypothetical protein [Gemmatimonadaceae bacterium]
MQQLSNDGTSGERFEPYRRPYLATHPALAAAQREFSRLSADLVRQAQALAAVGIEDKPDVRQSPQRCILQLGPVAATLTWLRSADSAADGQLLVVVWRGNIARPGVHQFERPRQGPLAAAATALWEGVYVATADNEASWRWQPQAVDSASCSSAELAAICAAELHRAHVES